MNYTLLLNNHRNKHILTKGNAKSRLVEIIHRFFWEKAAGQTVYENNYFRLSLTFSKTPFFSLEIVERAYENIIADYLVAATSFLSKRKKKATKKTIWTWTAYTGLADNRS